MKTKQEWKKKTRKIFVLLSFLIYKGCLSSIERQTALIKVVFHVST